jgi:hypothetical protein
MEVLRQEQDDPRDNLEKLLPDELYFFAKSTGITDINRAEPAMLMRKKLRDRGFVDVPLPQPRILGQPTDWKNEWSTGSKEDPRPSITADQLLQKQWEEQQKQKWMESPTVFPSAEKFSTEQIVGSLIEQKLVDVDNFDIKQLRKLCKSRGIKMARTDNLKTLREKLRA